MNKAQTLKKYWNDTFYEDQEESKFITLAKFEGADEELIEGIKNAFKYQTSKPSKFERKIEKVYNKIMELTEEKPDNPSSEVKKLPVDNRTKEEKLGDTILNSLRDLEEDYSKELIGECLQVIQDNYYKVKTNKPKEQAPELKSKASDVTVKPDTIKAGSKGNKEVAEKAATEIKQSGKASVKLDLGNNKQGVHQTETRVVHSIDELEAVVKTMKPKKEKKV